MNETVTSGIKTRTRF